MALMMKETVNFQISIRHFMHEFAGRLDTWEAALDAAKELSVEKKEFKSLDEANELLPAGTFVGCKDEFKQITERVDLLGESVEPYEKIVEDCKIKYSETILDILSKLMKARGRSETIDKFIDEVVPIIIPKMNVDAFVEMSSDRRNERLQDLLESDRMTEWASVLRMSVTEKGVLENCKKEAETLCTGKVSRGKVDEDAIDIVIEEATQIVGDDLDFMIVETLSDKVAHNNDFIQAKRQVKRVVERTMHRIHSRLYEHVETYLQELSSGRS